MPYNSQAFAVWRSSRTRGARLVLNSLAIFLAFGFALGGTGIPTQRPNFLVIMTDDQSHDTLTSQFMPNTKGRIADQGVLCSRGYMSTSICCPSRAAFLTGMYARNNGVKENTDVLSLPTVVDDLHRAGYYTGLAGKYLNSWPGNARPEFDFWAAWLHGYQDARMNIAGTFMYVPGYNTDVLANYALQFLNQVPSKTPFFLMFTPHAPHLPADPAPQYRNLYRGIPPNRPPNFNPAQQPETPFWLRNRPLMTRPEIAGIDALRLNQLRCLKSVDDAVGQILDLLEKQGKLDNTFIVFYSDNGYFWGEHRLYDTKNHVYEEASHVPFAIRYPPLVRGPRVDDRLVSNIDIAPTIYALSGITPPPNIDGMSLGSFLQNPHGTWRSGLLLEGWWNHYQALRQGKFVYTETDKQMPELYNTDADPYEMNNLVDNPAYKQVVAAMRKQLNGGRFQ